MFSLLVCCFVALFGDCFNVGLCAWGDICVLDVVVMISQVLLGVFVCLWVRGICCGLFLIFGCL